MRNPILLVVALLSGFSLPLSDTTPAQSIAVQRLMQPQAAGTDIPNWGGDAPVIVTIFRPGLAPRGCSDRMPDVTLAAWRDGVVVVAADPRRPKRGLRIGHVDPALVERAVTRLEGLEFFTRPEAHLVYPDGRFLEARVQHTGKVVKHFGDPDFKGERGDWWREVLKALEPLDPECTRPLAESLKDGKFRGYVAADWWLTPWVK